MKKIILVGYMGSGKSTIAKILAEELQIPFIDLDQYIEQELQDTISNIFKTKGELFFRKKEHEYFKLLMNTSESFVLSLGGGTPCYANNHLFLNHKNTLSFYLKASIDTLYHRLSNEVVNRPILAQNKEEPLDTFIAKQLFERSYFYYQATHTVTVDTKAPEDISSEIKKLLT